MSGNTPGPWRADSVGQIWAYDPRYDAPDTGEIAIGMVLHPINNPADADLFSAAPDLQAALQLIIDQDLLDPRESGPRDALAKAQRALAKSKGITRP